MYAELVSLLCIGKEIRIQGTTSGEGTHSWFFAFFPCMRSSFPMRLLFPKRLRDTKGVYKAPLFVLSGALLRLGQKEEPSPSPLRTTLPFFSAYCSYPKRRMFPMRLRDKKDAYCSYPFLSEEGKRDPLTPLFPSPSSPLRKHAPLRKHSPHRITTSGEGCKKPRAVCAMRLRDKKEEGKANVSLLR